MRNLWPEEIISTVDFKSPVTILREQASLLGKKTNNLVEAEVIQLQPNEFNYAFLIVAPTLDNYRYKLFTISHNINVYCGYPVTIDVGKEIGEEISPTGIPGLIAKSEDEFMEILRKIFNSKKTKRVVGTLLSWIDGAKSPSVINPIDGSEMVLIPAGEFIMGTSDAQIEELLRQFPQWKREWFANEQPQHRIYLDSYYIDRYPVTNAQYEQFVEATGYQVGDNWRKYYTAGKEKHPVVNANWHDANAYCKWSGKRLPSEAEWEKAARGTDGRLWPWSNEWDNSKCNFSQGRLETTTPVNSYLDGASPYGVMDMVGNVWEEWCANWYGEDYCRDSRRNPGGPIAGIWRIIRGGSLSNTIEGLRCAYRGYDRPDGRYCHLGFRCARDA